MNIKHIIIPDTGSALLREELSQAFTHEGFMVSRIHPDILASSHPEYSLAALLETGPALLLSINFQGLSRMQETLSLVKQHGGMVAVWCVDNPWNLLSAVKTPAWHHIPLFVTDKSFIEPLQHHGAEHVTHLPLAACPEFFLSDHQKNLAVPKKLAPVVFVGRSAFPEKATFFSGLSLPLDVQIKADRAMLQGGRPDVHWWLAELDLLPEKLWPGKKQRLPSYGAETCSLLWKLACIKACTNQGCDVFGDEAWAKLLPAGVRLLPPVDYYSTLFPIYSKARYSLCVTSLQLPSGLNQRHFDVWMAGGVCLTDHTPGLDLFPKELTHPVTFTAPEHIESQIGLLEKTNRQSLVQDWKTHISTFHTYKHRTHSILEALDQVKPRAQAALSNA